MSRGRIYEAIVRFFKDDDWNFYEMDDAPVLTMTFSGKNGRWTCYAQAREAQEQFVFYSVCPINAPKEKLAEVVEFITRANYGMIVGNFELDYNDGEIRYKTSIDIEGTDFPPVLVKQVVYANVVVVDRYLSGLMRVIYGDVAPVDEIAKIESMPQVDTPVNGDAENVAKLRQEFISQIEELLGDVKFDEDESASSEDDDGNLIPPDQLQ
ncbi:MAG: YbjN domain-containing protein [Phototrophicales bacterium]|nr:YbjN domain-containing protein [Phototrophicales bacterium]